MGKLHNYLWSMVVIVITLSNFQLWKLGPQTSKSVKIRLLNLVIEIGTSNNKNWNLKLITNVEVRGLNFYHKKFEGKLKTNQEIKYKIVTSWNKVRNENNKHKKVLFFPYLLL